LDDAVPLAVKSSVTSANAALSMLAGVANGQAIIQVGVSNQNRQVPKFMPCKSNDPPRSPTLAHCACNPESAPIRNQVAINQK
jgi:hypothetical protein